MNDFDTAKYYLGKLCPRQHKWNKAEQSLRRLDNRGCIECANERKRRIWQENLEASRKYVRDKAKAYRENKPEQYRKSRKRYRDNNRERILEQKRQSWARHKVSSLTKKKIYYQQNKHRITLSKQRYAQTPNGKEALARGRQKYRARKLSSHHMPYSRAEVQQQFEQLGHVCSYCKESKPLTIDHFIPLSKGGSDTLGNLLPACWSCNSSKQDKDPLEWYQSQEFYSRKQEQLILKVLGKDKTNYDQLPLL